jgi:hypothetical protein
MTEARAAAAPRRIRRPIEAAARLDRPRQRTVDDLQGQQDAERRIETARRAYVALDQQIEQIRAAAFRDINQIRQQQAIAVWQMSRTGRTVGQISELLGISQADAWQLLSAGRSAAAHATDDRLFPRTNPPDPQQPPAPPDMPSAQQRLLSWIDVPHHDTDPRVVCAIPHGAARACERTATGGITPTSA